jgi:hypothetical protein
VRPRRGRASEGRLGRVHERGDGPAHEPIGELGHLGPGLLQRPPRVGELLLGGVGCVAGVADGRPLVGQLAFELLEGGGQHSVAGIEVAQLARQDGLALPHLLPLGGRITRRRRRRGRDERTHYQAGQQPRCLRHRLRAPGTGTGEAAMAVTQP